ncbi:hypothetical protein BRARA_I01663 [Brassica rapa]|uniref:AAA+ ATPase domain-containing protein n=1 Tax=Brassica campestris TaxID=3711 RepID=A0A397XWF8_BRACM|nr:hypothetical protein BRARA_I01663 [Brassica rapa]
MSGELVSFAIEKLWDLLSHEYEQFKGVEDQVNELKTDLNTLKSFLKDANAKKHTDEVVRSCVERINEIVLDAEDTIERTRLKDVLGKRGIARFVPERRNIALEIRSLSEEIKKAVRDMKDFKVHQRIDDVKDPQPSPQRQEYPKIHEGNLVGMEANVKTLLGYLVEQDDIQVVSITGMAGLGKTTLARQVFHDNLVKKKFDRLAWVCVSHVCDHIKVWQAILQNFRSKEQQKEIQKMTRAALQGELFELLETSNSLIVLDDIWNKKDWDLIKRIFPHKAGSKVLLTSRNERVAGPGETYKDFKPECLSDQDSWTLFKSIAMPRKDASEMTPDDKEMEKMGKKMMEHCRGLPLAIRVLGGLLAEKYTIHNWERLSENIRSHLVGGTSDDNNNSLNHILSLSFEELPVYLKLCFLYLAHFPEDYEINVEDLSYYWAAEGILKYGTGDSNRDNSIGVVGDNYIWELVRRNMVISEIDKTTGRFETCRLHDLMREICLYKAKEENFLHTVGVSSPTSHYQSRRFVSHDPTTLNVEKDISNPKVRSLVVFWKSDLYSLLAEDNLFRVVPEDTSIDTFDKKDGALWSLSDLGLTRLELLRVLHLPGAKFEERKLSDSIGELIHLRYLNLEGAWVSHLPSSLQNLKLLIYLNLNVTGLSHLLTHTYLLGMEELRYLALPRCRRKKRKLELNHLINLETLVNFSTEYCDLEDLRGMSRLRTLGIKITDETSLENLSASIHGLRHLENIDIVYEGAKGTKEGRVPMGTNKWSTLLEFDKLNKLKLSTNIPLLSGELQFPSRLTSLYLFGSGLKEDPMWILEKLVHLKEVKLGSGSFSGRRMVCSRGGFPQLQKLYLGELEKLKEWIVEEGSMPLLYTLSIDNCKKLKEFPVGLPFITSLKYLRVENMGEEWKKRLSEGGEDYYKVQHIPSVEIMHIIF